MEDEQVEIYNDPIVDIELLDIIFTGSSFWYVNKQGQRHGDYCEFYDRGYDDLDMYSTTDVRLACAYENGIIHGNYKEFYPDHTTKIQCQYENGKLEGNYIEYYMTGIPRIIADYKNGLCHGKYQKFYIKGGKWVDCSMIDGEYDGTVYEYFYTGKMSRTCQYVDRKKHGYETTFFENGDVRSSGSYENDIKIGRWIDTNISKMGCITYNFNQKGQLHGEYQEFDNNFNMTESHIYEDGVRIIQS